jgi:NAD+ synthase (glutamine-hydrolysing)
VAVLGLRLAFAQTNPVVGDFAGNAAAIESLMRQAHAAGVDVLLFGELALNGYPMADHSYRRDLLDATATQLERLVSLSEQLPGLHVVLGHLSSAKPSSNQVSYAIAHNSASVFSSGTLLGTYHKQRLPNYDVFDDWRNFVPGEQDLLFDVKGVRCAIAICEDIWGGSQGQRLSEKGAELILVPNGSPFTLDKFEQRRVAARAFAPGSWVAYGNLSGGQDELVFDGDSFLIDGSGTEVFRADSTPGLKVVNAGELAAADPEDRLWGTLVTGLRDYCGKTGQTSVVLGLSGGIDSALCAAIAAEALGPKNVFGVGLPSRYSSDHSLADAEQLAANLAINYRVVGIEPAHGAFEQVVTLEGLAGENIQARIRATILMAISNSEGHLLLTTGNKSEVAVGYSTIYGDSAGGFAPIKDLYKTRVWEVSRYVNARAGRELIPISSIEKPPSAELRPGQLDQDSLPDYAVLDAILENLVDNGMTIPEVIAAGFDSDTVHRTNQLLQRAEWKRSQGAIGTKVTSVAFGRGRRVPLTTRFGQL